MSRAGRRGFGVEHGPWAAGFCRTERPDCGPCLSDRNMGIWLPVRQFFISRRLLSGQRQTHKGDVNSHISFVVWLDCGAVPGLSVLEGSLVRYGQLLTTFRTAGGQYLATVCRRHSLTESVFVDSLPARRLERSFHCHSCISFLLFLRTMRSANV